MILLLCIHFFFGTSWILWRSFQFPRSEVGPNLGPHTDHCSEAWCEDRPLAVQGLLNVKSMMWSENGTRDVASLQKATCWPLWASGDAFASNGSDIVICLESGSACAFELLMHSEVTDAMIRLQHFEISGKVVQVPGKLFLKNREDSEWQQEAAETEQISSLYTKLRGLFRSSFQPRLTGQLPCASQANGSKWKQNVQDDISNPDA